MGRMYGKGKGISSSALPYQRTAPTWLRPNIKKTAIDIAEEATTLIHELAKGGNNPSKIGKILRDSWSIPQVKAITGSKILRLLKLAGLAPEIPEDLKSLIDKAKRICRHLDYKKRSKDKASKFRYILVKSRIARLIRYYQQAQKLGSRDIKKIEEMYKKLLH